MAVHAAEYVSPSTLSHSTFLLNLDPPISNGIDDFSVLEDASPETIDLFDVFDDPEDADEDLNLSVVGNTNSSLVTTGINDSNGILTLIFSPNLSGSSTITIRVTDTEGFSIDETFTVTVNPVNDVPSFNVGFSPSVAEDAGPQAFSNWATNISAGPNEGDQDLDFIVSATNSSLFSELPSVNSNGDLSFTPANTSTGISTVTISLMDNGGTANGGIDESPSQTFTITITNGANDPPTSSGIEDVNELEDANSTLINLFDAFEDAEDNDADLVYAVTSNTNPALFTSVFISAGILNLSYAPDANGSSILEVRATDTGGLSTSTSFTVNLTAVNDEPSFTKGADLTVSNSDPLRTFDSWATNIDKGAPNESFQNLIFSVSTPNTNLFSIQPSINDEGTLSFQPEQNSSGVATVTVVLLDDGGTANGGDDTSSPQVFTITVSNSNGPPTTSGIADVNANEDSPPAVISLFNAFEDQEDNDADLTFTVEQVSNPDLFTGGVPVINPISGILTLTFVSDAFGTSTVTVKATDTDGLSTSTTFTVTLNPVNDAPSFTAGPNISVPEDSPPQNELNWATNILAGPPNESTQTTSFSLSVDDPTLFSVQPTINANGALTFTPGPDAFGSTNITASISDDGGTENGGVNTSTPIIFTITLNPVNDPPVVMDDDYRLPEGEALIASAGGNPPGFLDNDSDVDGDVLQASIVQEPSFDANWSFNSDGSFFYLHDGSENIVDTFTYQVTDGTVTSRVVTVTITIIPENDPPEALGIQDIRVNEDAADMAISLFDAFDDPDDPDSDLTFSVENVSNPAIFDDLNDGSINQQTGVLTLDYLNNSNGFSTVTVKATDPFGSSAETTFDVEIIAVNDPPSMVITETIELDEDPGPQSISNWATNISAGPPDESNQQLSANITANSNPALFSAQPVFVINGNTGTLTFTPAPQAGGIAELSITLLDTGGLTNGGQNASTYDFAIIIRGDNDRPTSINIEEVVVLEDGTLPTFDLFSIFDDVEDADSLLTFTVEGEVNDSLLKDVQILGTPAILEIGLQEDAYGNTSITVRATDTEGLWAEENIDIEILSVNDAPTFTRGDDIVITQNSPAQTFTNWATDIQVGPPNEQNQLPAFVVLSNDNQDLFSVLPAISTDGTLTFEPSLSADASGTATVVIALVDNGGTENNGVDQSEPDTLLITLQRFNTAPTANNDNYIVDQGQSIQLDVSLGILANDSDPEGDPLTARVITPPVNGSLTVNPDGSFTYQHDNSLTTNDAFTYVANDGFEDSNVASVTISVQPLNTLFLQEITVPEDSDSTRIDITQQIFLPDDVEFEFEISSISDPTLFSRVTVDTLSGVISLVYAPNQFGFSSININATSLSSDPINATQNVTILPINDPPIAVDDIAATIENNPVEINVLNNDVDFDNDDLTIRTFSQPANGQINPRSNGSFLYIPPTDFTGDVTFSYVVGDDSLANDEGLVRITVFAGQFGVSQLTLQNSDISAAYSVSNAGEVVGVKRTPGGVIKAFSSEQELVSETPSEASSANDFGQVVGAIGLPQPQDSEIITFIASRWDTSGITSLGSFDNRTSKAFSINNEGLIVGTSTWDNSELLRGFIWDDGVMKPLETNPTAESQAFGISETGQIAGYEGSAAVIWNGERILRRLSGVEGRAYDVNENGQAIGSVDDGTVKSVIWEATGSPVILHPDGSLFSEAYGINNSKWVVGTFLPSNPGKQLSTNNPLASRRSTRYAPLSKFNQGSDGETKESGLHSQSNENLRAFLWQGDQLVDLNDLIDPNSGWVLLEARSINNAAQISGIGLFNGEQRAFLLSPTNNKAPTARNDIIQLEDLNPIDIHVTSNDEDENGDSIRVIRVSQGSAGRVSISDNNTVTYTPGDQFKGSDSFTYLIADVHGASAEAEVLIERGTPIPINTFLSQNYPNPFNPATTIQFGVSESARVKLELFNVLGQRIQTLIDSEYDAGTYEISFDAGHLPGGVYLYRMQTDHYSESKQFVLLK